LWELKFTEGNNSASFRITIELVEAGFLYFRTFCFQGLPDHTERETRRVPLACQRPGEPPDPRLGRQAPGARELPLDKPPRGGDLSIGAEILDGVLSSARRARPASPRL
jgi:hypothetical protein